MVDEVEKMRQSAEIGVEQAGEEKEEPLSGFFYLLNQIYPWRLCPKKSESFQYFFWICDPKGEEGTMREKEIKYNDGVFYVGKGSHNGFFFTDNRVQDHLQTALNLYESKWEGKLTTLPQMLCWAWRNRTLVYLQV